MLIFKVFIFRSNPNLALFLLTQLLSGQGTKKLIKIVTCDRIVKCKHKNTCITNLNSVSLHYIQHVPLTKCVCKKIEQAHKERIFHISVYVFTPEKFLSRVTKLSAFSFLDYYGVILKSTKLYKLNLFKIKHQ